tara:strand:- start:2204 stop:2977 length:774 start_codon:yes stop_codon:yes gene_type:complete
MLKILDEYKDYIKLDINSIGLPLVIFIQGYSSETLIKNIKINNMNISNKYKSILHFYGYNSTHHFKNFNKLYITDPYQLNFMYGFKENEDILVVFDLLKKIINMYNPSKIITIGCSAGGYNALLFSNILNVDTIFSFSPQTYLINNNGENNFYIEHLAYPYLLGYRLHHFKSIKNKNIINYFDLNNLKLNCSDINIFYDPEFTWKADNISSPPNIDKINIEHLKHSNIKLHKIYNAGHNTDKYLWNSLIIPFLENLN